MVQSLDAFRSKFQVERLQVAAFDHWTWSIRPGHCTLGASVFSLNRGCTAFADVSADETAGLAAMVQAFEKGVRSEFGADKFNYLMLMMVDDQVHFHALPRYAESRQRFGRQWDDTTWPSLPNLGDGAELASSPILDEVRDVLMGRAK